MERLPAYSAVELYELAVTLLYHLVAMALALIGLKMTVTIIAYSFEEATDLVQDMVVLDEDNQAQRVMVRQL